MVVVSVTFPVPQIDDLGSLCVRRRRTAEPHCEAVRSDLDQTGGETSQLAPVLNTLLPPVIHTVELHTAAISDRVHHYSDSLPEQTVLWRVFKSDFLHSYLSPLWKIHNCFTLGGFLKHWLWLNSSFRESSRTSFSLLLPDSNRTAHFPVSSVDLKINFQDEVRTRTKKIETILP